MAITSVVQPTLFVSKVGFLLSNTFQTSAEMLIILNRYHHKQLLDVTREHLNGTKIGGKASRLHESYGQFNSPKTSCEWQPSHQQKYIHAVIEHVTAHLHAGSIQPSWWFRQGTCYTSSMVITNTGCFITMGGFLAIF
jgi:hypothetical protein